MVFNMNNSTKQVGFMENRIIFDTIIGKIVFLSEQHMNYNFMTQET